MAKKKRRAPTIGASEFLDVKTIDYKKKALDEFLTSYQGKKMYLSINAQFYIRVKILEGGNKDLFENVLVKILEKPEWLLETHGYFLGWKGMQKREWKTAVCGTKLYVNKLSLLTVDGAMKRLQASLDEKRTNLVVIRTQLKHTKKYIEIMEAVEKNILKKSQPE